MRGFWLILIFLMIRFGLLAIVNRNAVRRAGYFAPMRGNEKIAYYVYQISNITLFICLIGSSIKIDHSLMFHIGAACYLVGLFFCAISIICFSFPDDEGLNIRGIYQFSRHPMYVSYFACFSGMALLTQSWVMLIIVIFFQISAHWIILSEERWCLENFGKSYENYMKKVRRYI